MATSCHAPAPVRRCISKTPSGNPLPRRGQVKEKIAKHIITAVQATAAAVLACDKTGVREGGGKPPAAAGAKKK